MTTASAAALAAELTLLTCDQPLTEEMLVAVHAGLARIDAAGAPRPALHAVGNRLVQLPARAR